MKNIFLHIEDSINDGLTEFLPGVYHAYTERQINIFRMTHIALRISRDIQFLSNSRMDLKPAILNSDHMKASAFLIPQDFGTPISEMQDE